MFVLMGRCCGNKAVAMFFAGCLLVNANAFVRADEDGDAYRAAVEARATKAEQSGDAIQLIEAAFALYPLDAQKGGEKPRSTSLVNKAVEVTLAKNDPALAGKVLELSSPLSGLVGGEKLQNLEKLALGKSVSDVAENQVEKSSENLKKYGPDFGNPEIKGRGEAEQNSADNLGKAVLFFCRPSAALDDRTRMTKYKFEQSGSDRITLTASFRWHGFFTDNPYDSEVEMELMVSDGCLEILSMSYDDDCPTPCENLRELNSTFRKKINNLLRTDC
jgi:hypothetical protein